MSTNTNTTSSCPDAAVPEPINLGIDSHSPFAVVPRRNYTAIDTPDEWMTACCAPNAVHIATDNSTGPCWEWCQVPAQYTNWTSDSNQMSGQFFSCIRTAAGRNSSTGPKAMLFSAAAGRDRGGGGGIVGVLALVVVVWQLLA